MTPDANDLCVFAVKRGIIEGRIDPHFYLPKFQSIIEEIKRNKYVRLENIAQFSKETTDYSEYKAGDFEYLEISGISLGLNKYQTTTVLVSEAPSRAKMKTQKGDIVIALTRPHRGAIALIKESSIIASTGFSVIRETPEQIDKEWLLFVLLSNLSLQQLLQRSSGGNYPAIIEDEVKRIYIPIVKYSKQLQMAEYIRTKANDFNTMLQKADSFLNNTSYILERIGLSFNQKENDLSFAVLRSMIADRIDAEYYHPERMAAIRALKSRTGLSVVKLFDIVDFCRETVNSNDNPNQYLGLAGVQSHTGELSGIVEDAAGQAFKYEVGDILYGRLRPYLNKVLLAETSGICSTEFHVMRIKESVSVLPDYLASILRSDLILAQTKHMMTGNTHPRISNDDVKNLYIPVPEVSVQRQIVEELGHRRTEARKLKQQAEADWSEAKARFERELLGET